MSTRIPAQPSAMRKTPRQARSRVTVENILEAGTRLLGADGWAGFNTNRVAELAGVSIGSLYQYFPDKLSLVDAIRQRHLDDCLAAVRNASDNCLSSRDFATRIVTNMNAAHSATPGLHRALLDEVPVSEKYRDPHSQFEIEYLSCYAQALASQKGRKTPNDQDHLSARIISDAIDGVIHNAARRGETTDEGLHEALIRLICSYLEQLH